MAIVETRYGKVEGHRSGSVLAFKGIPYAAAPVGDLRWHPPEAPAPWPGVRAATEWGKQAWQPAVENAGMLSFVFNARNAAFRDEDCLLLNVWTPQLDDAKRPVLVWIHGGGFAGGTGGTPVYDGTKLASRGDAVVVSINYRVGALGFLNLSALTGGRIPASGNEGLLDQTFALAWIRDNIASFGGDPGNVTVLGESAGAMSISALLVLDAARGLFHRAVPMSGAASAAHSLERAVQVAEGIVERLGLTAKDAGKLMTLAPEAITNAASGFRLPGGGMTFQPCIDGVQIPALPLDAIRRGTHAKVPVLVGTQRDEWRGFTRSNPLTANLDQDGLVAEVSKTVADAPAIIEGYRGIRASRGAATDPVSLFAAIETDRKMRLPAIHLAEALAAQGDAAYQYIFAAESPWDGGALGSPHAIIIGFVFGTHAFSDESAAFFGRGETADAISAHLQDALIGFARDGHPRTDALPNWAAYDAQTRTVGWFGDPVAVVEAPFEEERALWDGRAVSEPFGPARWG